jgi:flagellar protein FlgJ
MTLNTTLPLPPILPQATDAGAQNWLDVQGLEPLKGQAAASPHDPATLRAVAQQFEALMINMMMKSMREAKLGDGLFDSDQTRLYQDLFDEQLSLSMSQGKGLGIADLLVRSLTPHGAAAAHGLGTYGKQPRRGPSIASAISGAWHGGGVAALGAGGGGGGGTSAIAHSPKEFVALVMPDAEAAGAELGVDPLALVAQAALESNWGRQIPAADGASSNNLFGIKADAGWTGRRTVKDTLEYSQGVAERRREPIRAYASVGHGFEDYVAFLKGNDRYAAALQQGTDGEAYAVALHRAGYATDPDYSTKMTAILRGSILRDAVASLKKPEAPPIF